MTLIKFNRLLILPSLAALLLAPAVPLHALEPAAALYALEPGAPALDDNSTYAAGTRAMNDQRWQDAIQCFDKVIDSKDRRADAALYWKAYSLDKVGRQPLALATCFQLRSQFKSSPWNSDCAALRLMSMPNISVNIPPIPTIPAMQFDFNFDGVEALYHHSGDPGEDIKMLALNSLLRQDPARAIPLLRGVLTGNQSSEVKGQAIFVLAHSQSPEAQSILNDAVSGKMGPEPQRHAIQMTAFSRGKRSNDSLAEAYRNTSDREVKKAIISAFFLTQDAPRMVDLARKEKDLELKRTIVVQLALMNDKAATDYMLELLK